MNKKMIKFMTQKDYKEDGNYVGCHSVQLYK